MPQFAERTSAPPLMKSAAPAAARPQPHRSSPVQRAVIGQVLQRRAAESAAAEAAQKAPNRSGLPKMLKAGIERLSGLAMDDVRVHRNSAEPGKLGALAFTKGSDIHLGPGQEQHLPHEAWHVVQQKQGRVVAPRQLVGLTITNDESLEVEADRMGALAATTLPRAAGRTPATVPATPRSTVQAKLKRKGKWLDLAKGQSKVVQDHIGYEANFLMSQFEEPNSKVIHVLEESRKYLLGETHGSGKWEKNVKPWPDIGKMLEGRKAIPVEKGDPKQLFAEPAGRFKQPLESSHPWLLRVTLDAHNTLNVLEWVFSTFGEEKSGVWKTWTKSALSDLGQIDISYYNDYEVFWDIYEKKYKPSLWNAAKATYDPAPARLAQIYQISIDLRDYYTGALSKLMKAVKQADTVSRGGKRPKGPNWFSDMTGTIKSERTFLPKLAGQLISLEAQGPEESEKLTELTTVTDESRDEKITETVDSMREREMARNVSAAAPPLLVQLGNDHVTNVAVLVGPSAIGIGKDSSFKKLTKRP